MRSCMFCGSLACEWDGGVQLGCADCGYEIAEELIPQTKLDTLLERAAAIETPSQWERVLFDSQHGS